MSSTLSVDIAFGIPINDENEETFPWVEMTQEDDYSYYEGDHMEDFEEWAPEDCPFEIDMWGNLQRWEEGCYVLKVKNMGASDYDDVLVFEPSLFFDFDRQIHDAIAWAHAHNLPTEGLTWMVVPCVS